MPAPAAALFELELLGGPVEARYRARRPQTEQMPWGTLDVQGLSQAQLLAARRGWTDMALAEYSAAAAQAEVLRLLVRACAPLDLSAMLTGFPFDELVHTELCARLASELGGTTPLRYPPARVFPPPLPDQDRPLLQAAEAVVREFCVAETVTLASLELRRRHATQPLLRAVWGRLVQDEAAHARFGWLFLDWALPQLDTAARAHLHAAADEALARAAATDVQVRQQPDEAFVSVGIFGAVGRESYLAASLAARRRVARRIRAALAG